MCCRGSRNLLLGIQKLTIFYFLIEHPRRYVVGYLYYQTGVGVKGFAPGAVSTVIEKSCITMAFPST